VDHKVDKKKLKNIDSKFSAHVAFLE